MKDSARRALQDVQKLTQKVCEGCATRPHPNMPKDTRYRCCDREFCLAVQEGLNAIGVQIPHTQHPTLPFMGEKGCVVPAEYRPGCSGYVCKGRLDSRPLRRQYQLLHKKFEGDPEVQKMMAAANFFLKRFYRL